MIAPSLPGSSARSASLECAKHPSQPAAARCIKCNTPLCDPCIAFSINDAPWCGPCGNVVVDETKPLWVPAILVAVVGMAFVTLATLGGIRVLGVRFPWILTVVATSIVLALAAKLVRRTTMGDAPNIVARKPGDPLPRLGRRGISGAA